MLRMTTPKSLLWLVLVGLAMSGTARPLHSQNCCSQFTKNEWTCTAPACSQTVYYYTCDSYGYFAYDIGYVSCCNSDLPSDYLTGYCVAPAPARAAREPGTSLTTTYYVMNCSHKYVLVELAAPQS